MKTYPSLPPERDPNRVSLKRDPKTGAIVPMNGEATAGTIIHDVFQKTLRAQGFKFQAEKPVKFEHVTFPGISVQITGHIDISMKDAATLIDIKTVGSETFKEIATHVVDPEGMENKVARKVEEAVAKTNIYAVIEGIEQYYIMWVNRENLSYIIVPHATNSIQFNKTIMILVDVVDRVKRWIDDGSVLDTSIFAFLPDPGEDPSCWFCPFRNEVCKGDD